MDITPVAIVMSFGMLVAIAGLALLFFRKEHGENRIRLFGQEFQISTPALVVFLVGCFIFILPSVTQMQNQPVFSFHPSSGSESELQETVREGQNTNNQFATAKLVAVGATIKGVIANKDQRAFFKFKVGQFLNTRVILTKTATRGFAARVTIFDNAQSNVAGDYSFGEDSVTFVFRSNPNSYYYAKIESVGDDPGGPYELLLKEE